MGAERQRQRDRETETEGQREREKTGRIGGNSYQQRRCPQVSGDVFHPWGREKSPKVYSESDNFIVHFKARGRWPKVGRFMDHCE